MRLSAILLFILMGCTPIQTTVPMSLWGPIIILGQAEQMQAPALWPSSERITAGWIGADNTGIHQDVRVLSGSTLSDRVVLPLLPVHPYEQQFAPAGSNNLHILWLDAIAEGENRLYSAVINPQLEVLRGPTLISDQRTLRYAAVPARDGGVWVIWNGGLLAEPALYAQYIDRDGRPRSPSLIARGADWPSLIQSNNGTIHALWLEKNAISTRIHDVTLQNGVIVQASPETPFTERSGERLISVYAALDQTHLYLFWNTATVTGEAMSWMLSRPLDGSWPNSPVQLGVNRSQEASIETGFNSGHARAANSDGTWLALRQAKPISGQFDKVAVGAQMEDQLVVVYFQAGEAAAYQPIVTINSLLAPPALFTDQDRHLYLAWAEPDPNGYAHMKFTSTRR